MAVRRIVGGGRWGNKKIKHAVFKEAGTFVPASHPPYNKGSLHFSILKSTSKWCVNVLCLPNPSGENDMGNNFEEAIFTQ